MKRCLIRPARSDAQHVERTPKKSKTDTVAQVFIIESLKLVDEAKQRGESAVLASVLKMYGKNMDAISIAAPALNGRIRKVATA